MPSLACPATLPWNTAASELHTSRRSRSSSTSIPTDDFRSASVTSRVKLPAACHWKIVPSASEPVRSRLFFVSYSTPSGMKPPRLAKIVAGKLGVLETAVAEGGAYFWAGVPPHPTNIKDAKAIRELRFGIKRFFYVCRTAFVDPFID